MQDDACISHVNFYAIRLHLATQAHFDYAIGNKNDNICIDFIIPTTNASIHDTTPGNITVPVLPGKHITKLMFEEVHSIKVLANEIGKVEMIPEGQYGAGQWWVVQNGKASLERAGKDWHLCFGNDRFRIITMQSGDEIYYNIIRSTSAACPTNVPDARGTVTCSNISIQAIIPNDARIPQIAALLHNSFPTSFTNFETAARSLARAETGFVAMEDGDVVGVIYIQWLRDPSSPVAQIVYLATRFECRNKGVGSMLVRKAEQATRDARKRSLRLTTDIDHIRYYENLGFTVSTKTGTRGFLLEKKL
jgi:predicted N-acetyltransferase YhbS